MFTLWFSVNGSRVGFIGKLQKVEFFAVAGDVLEDMSVFVA